MGQMKQSLVQVQDNLLSLHPETIGPLVLTLLRISGMFHSLFRNYNFRFNVARLTNGKMWIDFCICFIDDRHGNHT